MTLAIGRISYLNAVPYFYKLSECGFVGKIVYGVPVELNQKLANGSLDLSPSSSYEYARNWRNYLLLPGHSISSVGPVQSVLLFSPLPLADLALEEIALTGESATSVNLLQVILREFIGAKNVNCKVLSGPVEGVFASGGNALLIGDRALQAARQLSSNYVIYDLGELWHRFTGLPFVFALWIVRKASFLACREAIRTFRYQLDQSLERAFADIDEMAEKIAPGSPLDPPGLVNYWRAVSYQLTPAHIAGMQTFFSLCVKHGLLPEEPQIAFTD